MTFYSQTLDRPNTRPESAPIRSEDDRRLTLDSIGELWLDGKSLTEIAEVLGVKRGVVAGLVSRARIRGDIRFRQRPRRPGQSRELRLELDRARKARRRMPELPSLPSARPPADAAPVVHSLERFAASPRGAQAGDAGRRPAALAPSSRGSGMIRVPVPPLIRMKWAGIFSAAELETRSAAAGGVRGTGVFVIRPFRRGG